MIIGTTIRSANETRNNPKSRNVIRVLLFFFTEYVIISHLAYSRISEDYVHTILPEYLSIEIIYELYISFKYIITLCDIY